MVALLPAVMDRVWIAYSGLRDAAQQQRQGADHARLRPAREPAEALRFAPRHRPKGGMMDRALARDEPEESRILSRALPLGPGRLLKGALLGVAAASGALALSGLETRYLVAIMVVI